MCIRDSHIVDEAGVVWYGMDMPGYGYSSQIGDPSHPAPPGHTGSFAALQEDMYTMVSLVAVEYPGLPLILAAHSWGAGQLVQLLPRVQESSELGPRLCGACISAPQIWDIGYEAYRHTAIPKLQRMRYFWPSYRLPNDVNLTSIRDEAVRVLSLIHI